MFNLTNFGDKDVTITIIAAAQHIATKYPARSVFETITVPALYLPSAAPTGDYIVQAILATGLSSNEGLALKYIETIT